MNSKLKEIAKECNIPLSIPLNTGLKVYEVELVLERVEKNDQFVYKIFAEYPYTVSYKDMEKQEILFIDFSGGPIINAGLEVGYGLIITKIVNNLVYLEKV